MTIFQRTIRLVTFDVTDTLLKFKATPGEQYSIIAQKCGVDSLDVERISRRFKENYIDMCNRHPNFGKNSFVKSWEEWWRYVVRRTFSQYVKEQRVVDQIADTLIECYKSKDFWTLNHGCIDLLDYIKQSDVTIGVISNFDPRLTSILKNVGIFHYFDFVLSSYEVGFSKPEPEMFFKALMTLNKKVTPSEAMHVGDDVELDYLAAKKCGWQAALISEKKNKKLPDHVRPDQVFCDLNHLKQCLLKHQDLFKERSL